MNENRKYAEDLLGERLTGHLDKNRQVAQDSYNTNWETIQNNFKNLKDRIEQKRAEQNRQVAQGLTDVAEGSFDRVNQGTSNLVSRGLTGSGLADRLTQSDTTAKGNQVSNLLDTAGDSLVGNVNTLSSGVTQTAGNERNSMSDLTNTLGNIGAADLSGQMNYNQAAASIANSKAGRDASNSLAAAQRALTQRSLDRDNNKTPEELEYERLLEVQGMNDILENEELDDAGKRRYLQIFFGLSNADSIVNQYNDNNIADKRQANSVKKLEDTLRDIKLRRDITEVGQADFLNSNGILPTFRNVGTRSNSNNPDDVIAQRERVRLEEELNRIRQRGATYNNISELLNR